MLLHFSKLVWGELLLNVFYEKYLKTSLKLIRCTKCEKQNNSNENSDILKFVSITKREKLSSQNKISPNKVPENKIKVR